MYILFTTSDKWLARTIRWATGEDCSHVAILIEDAYFGASIVHSNWKGVHGEPLNKFMNENRIIHRVEIPDTQENRERLLEILNSTLSNKCRNPYDIGALLFCGVVLFCRKALGLRKWPKVNLWQSSGMYLCTEFVTEYLDGKADSLITPGQLFVRLSSK